MKFLYGRMKPDIILSEIITIPEIDDQELQKLYKTLKPIITIEQMKYLLREFSLEELRTECFLLNREDNKTIRIDPKRLEPIEDFTCLHLPGMYDLFRPKISEILAQAPERTKEEGNTFEIIESITSPEDLEEYPELGEKSYQLSKVRSYKLH